jgi:hypothetical protein
MATTEKDFEAQTAAQLELIRAMTEAVDHIALTLVPFDNKTRRRILNAVAALFGLDIDTTPGKES